MPLSTLHRPMGRCCASSTGDWRRTTPGPACPHRPRPGVDLCPDPAGLLAAEPHLVAATPGGPLSSEVGDVDQDPAGRSGLLRLLRLRDALEGEPEQRRKVERARTQGRVHAPDSG
jgi:hypothetical protein